MVAHSGIKYDNLRAEMARRKIGIKDIAEIWGVTRDTAGRKLSGKSPIFLSEAINLSCKLFDDMELRHLFHYDASDDQPKAG